MEVGSEEVAVDLKVILQYGKSAPKIYENVVKEIQKAVYNMTGLKVVEVNMTVEGVQLAKEEQEDKTEERVK
ncbi:MAG: hypothetical protein PWP31_937 [Clostridia bacterium]|nr:hypothetical protein [Clostridia bacterium]